MPEYRSQIKPLFEDLFINLDNLIKAHCPIFSAEEEFYPVFVDINEKVEQLYFLFEDIQECEKTLLQKNKDAFRNKDKHITHGDYWIKLKTYAEAIYYIAHRLKKSLITKFLVLKILILKGLE